MLVQFTSSFLIPFLLLYLAFQKQVVWAAYITSLRSVHDDPPNFKYCVLREIATICNLAPRMPWETLLWDDKAFPGSTFTLDILTNKRFREQGYKLFTSILPSSDSMNDV